MNFLRISFIITLMFLFLGCSKNVLVTKEVFIPIKCEQEIPKRPEQTNDLTNDIMSILSYTESLELIILECVSNIKEN